MPILDNDLKQLLNTYIKESNLKEGRRVITYFHCKEVKQNTKVSQISVRE
jgi:hypothetical protein